jgi:hypothetical protein
MMRNTDSIVLKYNYLTTTTTFIETYTTSFSNRKDYLYFHLVTFHSVIASDVMQSPGLP